MTVMIVLVKFKDYIGKIISVSVYFRATVYTNAYIRLCAKLN